MNQPPLKPATPYFSSGPCAKRPGWSPDVLQKALIARSHRSSDGKERLQEVIELHRQTLGIPADYKIAIVPASDTGAVELCLWSMLGARGVDVLSFESFSDLWADDITQHLKIADTRVFKAPYGALPDPTQTSQGRDIVFVWNGTTSGVRIPNGDWIKSDRQGLTICDATSAVFAYDLPWDKLDATTWSWQKASGGEAAHGMLALSPRAVQRLQTYTPPWPLPKIFRLTKSNKLVDAIFTGDTINTPSMLAVEDIRDALTWIQSIGGLKETINRCTRNAAALRAWAEKTSWITDLAETPTTASLTSVCLKLTDPKIAVLSPDAQFKFIKDMTALLEREGVAFDIAGHRDAPPGLRIWCGATVETADLQALCPWLEWAYHETLKGLS